MSTASRTGNRAMADEATPLLQRKVQKEVKSNRSAVYIGLFCGFIVSLSFGVTQVPILYVLRIMSCDAYYNTYPLADDHHDRCDNREISAKVARAASLLGASTTIFGLINLLVTGWTIKRFGIKISLLIQIFWPAVRLAVQNLAVMTGGESGILLLLGSQIITIVGGPNGYVLTLNAFITDVSTHEQRTGALGRLQGAMTLGAATGFLTGGLIGDAFGILAPFRITLVLFLLCFTYVFIALPSIHQERDDSTRPATTGLKRFFGPLRIFAPQKWVLPDGRTSMQFGALTLGIGVFFAILATGYIPTCLQLFATDEFGFGTAENGWLIFIYSSLRGLFLSFVFPRIITAGRKWLQPKDSVKTQSGRAEQPKPDDEEPLLLVLSNEIGPIDPMDDTNIEPVNPPRQNPEKETYAFDLLYARFSLILDGILTGLAFFVTKGWQLFIVASLVPLAAGTGSSSKGSILQMIPSNERVDALSGITLVENIANLSTISLFGFVFAALAEVGQIHFIFLCNAGVALLGFCVLCLSRFPPKGSSRFHN
ncbi:major facilitator superfamily domain-containing protein [Dendryphion nanum]|uniref:Major facilitator superfamily domain-containing protein n=1 Tax=Dendryphion nanum TaxID=256645 RepID=A0A9P9EJA8_9PLEO|nr:major facilitator superfamily domain-containing protein [Dendryphion nanum]